MADDIEVTILVPREAADRIQRVLRIMPQGKQSADEALGKLVEGFAKAAVEEYLLYASGERVPSGIRDLRELRLRLLGQHLPGGLPTDVEVAAMFHLTTSQARNLLSGTRARYPDEFATLFADVAKEALRTAEEIDKSTFRITASLPLAAFISDLLSESVAQAPVRLQDASSRYDLALGTVKDLCAALEMDIGEVAGKP